ncbi:histidine phosphatase family protein [Polynucleobacter necessarius]|uniref:histidine phosphatase family protein n=1 Tax=Polynucleobacter necessarius TaxID=576610 RepID=UPI000E098B3E|nr:histidine phosphatase family protein [Polynucleobacter necessarius]HAT39652.1 histidine phosphatase family protein [Polynucleobacter sp.]
MKLIKICISLCAVIIGNMLPLAAQANLATDLHDSEHVLLMRHADAPGDGDPSGYQLNQCSAQRNRGKVQIAPSLGSFFDNMSLEKQQTKDLEKLIQSTLKSNHRQPLILATHHVNIQAYTGKVVGVNDMVLVKVNQNGQHISHQIYPSPRL